MSRFIDADALRQVLDVYSEKDSLGHTPVQLCDAMPTVDAVEVVRCDECRWYDKSTASGTYEPIAHKCILHQRFTIGIQFCSDGERQEEDDLPMRANHYGERREE